ncbi:hypothetical protein ACFQU2_27775 [Siccirubricoccus deserti]
MLPLTIDLSDWPVLLVGDGRAALARLDMLEAGGARDLTIFAEALPPRCATAPERGWWSGCRAMPRWRRRGCC